MNWTSITDALPPKDSLILVTGFDTNSDTPRRVVAAARLVDSWATDDAAEVFADDADFTPLSFDVTHWQEVPALP